MEVWQCLMLMTGDLKSCCDASAEGTQLKYLCILYNCSAAPGEHSLQCTLPVSDLGNWETLSDFWVLHLSREKVQKHPDRTHSTRFNFQKHAWFQAQLFRELPSCFLSQNTAKRTAWIAASSTWLRGNSVYQEGPHPLGLCLQVSCKYLTTAISEKWKCWSEQLTLRYKALSFWVSHPSPLKLQYHYIL